MKQNYLGFLQGKLTELIEKVRQFREEIKRLQVRKEKESMSNRLVYKSYNIRNYLEQLMLVKELVQRVSGILKAEIPDIRHV